MVGIFSCDKCGKVIPNYSWAAHSTAVGEDVKDKEHGWSEAITKDLCDDCKKEMYSLIKNWLEVKK